MAHNIQEEHLFDPKKIAWLLSEGLEAMDPGERQILLVMAETKVQDGYRPSGEEKQVIEKLRDLAGDDYDARDIKRKVKTMVKGRSKPDTSPLGLPPVFDRLIKRFRRPKQDTETTDEA
jgi:hypothetical protein